ncbi:MAG: glycosyltransferase family 2 protein [Lachnospiraceae bacterium]|nr:glycosyltransferase family 2 protein [Lachnospiraceae bacterium]
MQEEFDYKAAYERERQQNIRLGEKIVSLESQNALLSAKVDKLKNSLVYKIYSPFKKLYLRVRHIFTSLKNCGSPAGVVRKLKYRSRQRKAMASYGTKGFPNAEKRKAQSEFKFENPVKISILVPLYNTKPNFLKEMIESVTGQTYQNWELCLADGSDDAHGFVGEKCKEYASKDQRILYKKLAKNEGISGNTNECLKMATGEYIGLFDHDDVLHPSALFEYVKVINEKNADFIYCDEVTFKNGNFEKFLTMHFKPDYAIDNLRANNYICHFSVFKRTLLEGTELFRKEFDGSQDHDMILRLTDKAERIVHVPKVLYYWRSHSGSVSSGIEAKTYAIEAAKGAVADHLRRHGFSDFEITSTRAFETIFRIRYALLATPKVSVIIPNKDHRADLERCINSITERSTYPDYEIVVAENNSETEEIRDYYDELKKDARIKVVEFKGEFNYSAVNNLGVRESTGEYLILLNNDTEVITYSWIEELLMYAQRPDVGAVGAKLLYPDRTIQHAGVVLGLGAHRAAGHIMALQNYESVGYMGKLCYAQNISAVTGACLMVSRKKYDEVGGLNEDLKICLNDVDLCLKLREKGYLNIFTPFSELFHYESQSRGLDNDPAKAARYDSEVAVFKKRWQAVLDAGDPYYNPNVSLDHNDYTIKPLENS